MGHEVNEVVACRTITLEGADQRPVHVQIERPMLAKGRYECKFSIAGLSQPFVSRSVGIDSVQALWLALQMVGTRLYTSPEFEANLLSWNGMRNLGFPTPEGLKLNLPAWDE